MRFEMHSYKLPRRFGMTKPMSRISQRNPLKFSRFTPRLWSSERPSSYISVTRVATEGRQHVKEFMPLELNDMKFVLETA